MNIYNIQVRRDAHTITPVTVAEHEVAVLQTIFGEENVQNVLGQPIETHGLTNTDLAGEVPLSDSEFERLASKYGSDDKGDLIVESVFGKKASKGLERRMEDIAIKEAKVKAKATAKAEAESKDPTADTKAGKAPAKAKAEAESKDPVDTAAK